jgi:hypothetical protein
MATLEAIQPYVEQLFDDDDVKKQLSRAVANVRAARTRADKANSKKKMVQDERLRRRVMDAIAAAYAAGSVLAEAPRKQRRRKRGRVLALLVLAGAGAAVATNADARARVMGMLGQGGEA